MVITFNLSKFVGANVLKSISTHRNIILHVHTIFRKL